MPPLGGGEYGPELNDAVYQALLKKIQEQAMQQRAAARGEASRRGIAGSTFEANRIGAADRGEIQASTDAAVQMALENAARQREERLIAEQRAYQTSERQSSEQFSAGESQKGRDFNAAEGEKGRQFTAAENEKLRGFEKQQMEAQQQFQALEQEKQRAYQSGEYEKARQFESQQAQIQRDFQEVETQKQRIFAREERIGSQDFTSLENERARLFSESERLGTENFQAGQQALQNEFNALEANKNRAFQAGQMELAQQFEQQQAEILRAYNSREAEKQGRRDLLASGLGAGASVLGNALFGGGGMGAGGGILGGLFGGGAAGAGAAGATGAGGAGLAAGGVGAAPMIGGGLLAAANTAGSAYLGQSVAKSVFGGDNGAASRGYKFGSLLGGMGGPVAGVVGGLAGGAVGQGIGALSDTAKKLYSQPIKTVANAPKAVVTNVKNAVKKIFCFAPDTLVEMADGTMKRIDEVELGDDTRGGIVESVRHSFSNDLYHYKGVKVTGSHAVKQNGEWMRVGTSVYATHLPGDCEVVSLVTTDHRIFVDGIEFADEQETDHYEWLDLDESLDYLNGNVEVVANG